MKYEELRTAFDIRRPRHLEQFREMLETARPGTGNPDHDAAFERFAVAAIEVVPALLHERERLRDALSSEHVLAHQHPYYRPRENCVPCALLATEEAETPA